MIFFSRTKDFFVRELNAISINRRTDLSIKRKSIVQFDKIRSKLGNQFSF